MAKLTRTQKYAELRETLANDPEPSLSTKELSNYENRLNNITSHLSANDTGSNKAIEEITPIEQLVQSFKEEERVNAAARPAQPAAPVQPVSPVNAPANTPRDVINQAADQISTMITQEMNMINQQQPAQPAPRPVQQPVPAPAPVQHTPVTPAIQEPYTNIEVSPIGPMAEPIAYPAPQKEVAEFENEKPEYMGLYVNPDIEKAYRDSHPSTYEQQIHTGIIDQNIITPPRPAAQPVRPAILNQPADNHVIDHSNDVQNTFINEVMNEVDEHIKQNGQQTITQLTNDMVNEVRRNEGNAPAQQQYVQQPQYTQPAPQPVQQPAPAPQPYVAPAQPQVKRPVSDEQFTNTVTMEVNRIMEESAAPAPAQVRPQPVQQPAPPVAEQHPVLAQQLAEDRTEDVVEIKNINDTNLNDIPPREATTGTIPFIVTANDDELIEEEEEEGSNTVLNVILIILIIILIAVLGLIIFYILKTRKII